MLFVGQQLRYRPLTPRRHAAGDELVQDRQHFVPAHGAAFQQDLTYSQNLAVIKQRQGRLLQPVAAFSLIVDDILSQTLFCKKTAQRLHVTLNAPLRDMKLLRQFFFGENITADQP